VLASLFDLHKVIRKAYSNRLISEFAMGVLRPRELVGFDPITKTDAIEGCIINFLIFPVLRLEILELILSENSPN